MRINKQEIEAVRNCFEEVFKSGKIYLFGSRVDDSKKGGDIDLYLITEQTEDMLMKKIDFLVKLKQSIGDQKIDVIISRDKTRLIEQEALKNGIEL